MPNDVASNPVKSDVAYQGADGAPIREIKFSRGLEGHVDQAGRPVTAFAPVFVNTDRDVGEIDYATLNRARARKDGKNLDIVDAGLSSDVKIMLDRTKEAAEARRKARVDNMAKKEPKKTEEKAKTADEKIEEKRKDTLLGKARDAVAKLF